MVPCRVLHLAWADYLSYFLMEMGSDVALWEWILKICACLPFSPAEVWPASPQHVLFVSKMRKEHRLCPENKFYGGEKRAAQVLR